MNRYISCWVDAFEKLEVPFEFLDKDKNCIKTTINKKDYIFHTSSLPFVPSSIVKISNNKDLIYDLLHPFAKMAKLKFYLDYKVQDEFQDQVKFWNYKDLLDDVEKHFEYPVVAKPNRAKNKYKLALCHDRAELQAHLNLLFDNKDVNYDSLAIIEAYIEGDEGYYAVFFQNKLLTLLKDKPFFAASTTTPLVEIEDNALKVEITHNFTAALKQLNSEYIALRIIKDKAGDLVLKSADASFDTGLLSQEGSDDILKLLCKKIIHTLIVCKD